MNRIKSIFATILLLLLLTSISQAWQPPSVNGPIAISETDEDPWGGNLINGSNVAAARDITNDSNIPAIIEGFKIAASYIVHFNFAVQSANITKSESFLIDTSSGSNKPHINGGRAVNP